MTLAPDAATQAAPPTPAPILARPRPFYWSVRRELWESRSLVIAPTAVAALMILGVLIGLTRFHQVHVPHGAETEVAMAALGIAAGPLTLTGVIVGVFYCLGALHNERRDRSILFWRSLPVSDATAVLAKASIPLLVLPVILLVAILVLQLVLLLLSTGALAAQGLNPATAWRQYAILAPGLAYGLIAMSLWYAPIYGWLLLISSWARRAPFLWAVLPPIGLAIVEQLGFGTKYVGNLVNDRLLGWGSAAFEANAHIQAVNPLASSNAPGFHSDLFFPDPDPAKFLTSPGLWIGLAFAIAFLAAAIWMRRRRGLI